MLVVPKWTKKKYEAYLKEGRGQGEKKEYIPWIKVQDLPKNSSVDYWLMSPGWTTQRCHHIFSKLESYIFFLFEWSDAVIDIRERYPLLDLDLAMAIAEEAGIKYPKRYNTPHILTVDFFVTLNTSEGIIHKARSICHSEALEDMEIIEILEIKRRYFAEKEIDWAITTEKAVEENANLYSNLEFLHGCYFRDLTIDRLENQVPYLIEKLQSDEPILTVINSLNDELRVDPGSVGRLFWHLVARKKILVDLKTYTLPLNISKLSFSDIALS